MLQFQLSYHNGKEMRIYTLTTAIIVVKCCYNDITRLSQAKFSPQKNFLQLSEIVRAQDIPRIPPPALRDWGATPAILWG